MERDVVSSGFAQDARGVRLRRAAEGRVPCRGRYVDAVRCLMGAWKTLGFQDQLRAAAPDRSSHQLSSGHLRGGTRPCKIENPLAVWAQQRSSVVILVRNDWFGGH